MLLRQSVRRLYSLSDPKIIKQNDLKEGNSEEVQLFNQGDDMVVNNKTEVNCKSGNTEASSPVVTEIKQSVNVMKIGDQDGFQAPKKKVTAKNKSYLV